MRASSAFHLAKAAGVERKEWRGIDRVQCLDCGEKKQESELLTHLDSAMTMAPWRGGFRISNLRQWRKMEICRTAREKRRREINASASWSAANRALSTPSTDFIDRPAVLDTANGTRDAGVFFKQHVDLVDSHQHRQSGRKKGKNSEKVDVD